MNNEQKSSSLDDLLANLENDHQHKQKSLGNQKQPFSSPSSSMKDQSSNSIDNYLNQIQTNVNKKSKSSQNIKPQKQPKKTASDDLLADIQAQFKQKKNPSSSPANIDENYLDNIAQNFQAKRQQESEVQKQEKLQLIQQEELDKQRRRKQFTIKAQEWLKNLDPKSDEGFWFEEFAYSYDSRLEAAIDYLQALES